MRMSSTTIDELKFSSIGDESLPWEKKDPKSIELKSLLTKWDLLPDLLVKSFRVSNQVQRSDQKRVIEKMLSDPIVCSSIGTTKSTSNSDVPENDLNFNLTIRQISCTVLDTKFFDKLVDVGLVSDNDSGYIRGCYDEEIDGIFVQDRLRRMCAKDNEGSEYILDDQDRNEFIFHLLKLVSIGGAKCQCEDKFHKLKDATITLYKEVLQVRKDPSGDIGIYSSVYEICINGNNHVFPFPHNDNVHNKFFIIFSGQKVTFIIKRFVPFW